MIPSTASNYRSCVTAHRHARSGHDNLPVVVVRSQTLRGAATAIGATERSARMSEPENGPGQLPLNCRDCPALSSRGLCADCGQELLGVIALMRAIFLAEHAVRVLDPNFQILESLRKNGAEALKAAMEQSDWSGALERLKLDALTAMQDLPSVLGSWTRRLNQEGEGLGLNLRLQGLEDLEARLDRSSNRVALALVTLGLYIAGSLLMQHSLGPRLYGDIPVIAALAFGLALWFTFRLARGIARSGRL